MIYILSGNDTKNKNIQIKKLAEGCEVIALGDKEPENLISDYACNSGLFGGQKIIIFENIIGQDKITFKEEEIKALADSLNTFVFLEDKLLVEKEGKYKKYSKILKFEDKKVKTKSKPNNFVIADAFALRDKIKTWAFYRQAIEEGTPPEAISGMLFWKIKTMILNGSKFFTQRELKTQSSNIVSLYHKSHRGELDFVIGLEQFILSSLSK